jgi:hypothetical protein
MRINYDDAVARGRQALIGRSCPAYDRAVVAIGTTLGGNG